MPEHSSAGNPAEESLTRLAPNSRFAPETRIGPYSLVRFLGRGGFGEVWLADRESGLATTRLAIKLPLDISPELSEIRREAELWVRACNHPNILSLFEAGIYDGQIVIASEYAPDGSLKNWLAQHGGKAPTVLAAVDLLIGILRGLEHIHERGIVHRDLKPANILMQHDTPRLADFGLARLFDPDGLASRVAGTPPYMSPEALSGSQLPTVDIWSAGVIGYQLLSGRLPFPQRELGTLVQAISNDPANPLPESVPVQVRDIIAVALRKDVENRFSTATGMRQAFDTVLSDDARTFTDGEGDSTPDWSTETLRQAVRAGSSSGRFQLSIDSGSLDSAPTLISELCRELERRGFATHDNNAVRVALHELISNGRHAQSPRVTIEIIVDESQIECSVQDSGEGFDWNATIQKLATKIDSDGREHGLLRALRLGTGMRQQLSPHRIIWWRHRHPESVPSVFDSLVKITPVVFDYDVPYTRIAGNILGAVAGVSTAHTDLIFEPLRRAGNNYVGIEIRGSHPTFAGELPSVSFVRDVLSYISRRTPQVRVVVFADTMPEDHGDLSILCRQEDQAKFFDVWSECESALVDWQSTT